MAICSISEKVVTLIVSFLALVIYMLMGAACFSAIELPYEKLEHNISVNRLQSDNDSASPAVQALTYDYNASACFAYESIELHIIENEYEHHRTDEDPLSWTYTKSIMFSFSVMSTLGYGDLVPVTTISKGMAMVFGISTIPLYFIMIILYAKQGLVILDSLIGACSTDHASKIRAGILAGLFLFLFLTFTGVYTARHETDYLNAMWFTFATFTTLGFGDMTPDNNSSFHAFYFILFTTISYILIAMIGLALSDSFLMLHRNVSRLSRTFCKMCCGLNIVPTQEGTPRMTRLRDESAVAEMEPIPYEMEQEDIDDRA